MLAITAARYEGTFTTLYQLAYAYVWARRYRPKCGTVNAIRPRSPE